MKKNSILLTLFFFILNLKFSYAQVSRNFNKRFKPEFELGVGAGYLSVPNYPGSKNNTFYFIPFPYFIYRGDVLRADEDGTRARVLSGDVFEIGLSAGFNFPLNSKDNKIREGMPDKSALLGLGPSFLFKLIRNKTHKLTTGVGVRTNVLLSDFSNHGLLVEPFLRYWFKPTDSGSLTFFFGCSYSAATSSYHSFYYEVESQYVTATRKEFKTTDGTIDFTYSFGFNFDLTRNISVYSGIVYSDLSSSSSKDSDLLENQHTIGFGVGFTWLLYESRSLVF